MSLIGNLIWTGNLESTPTLEVSTLNRNFTTIKTIIIIRFLRCESSSNQRENEEEGNSKYKQFPRILPAVIIPSSPRRINIFFAVDEDFFLGERAKRANGENTSIIIRPQTREKLLKQTVCRQDALEKRAIYCKKTGGISAFSARYCKTTRKRKNYGARLRQIYVD